MNKQFLDNQKIIIKRLHSIEGSLADVITRVAGSMTFIYFHIVWFTCWLLINTGKIPTVPPFDQYPFGLLTTIVSLEAIFLATFIMVAHNRQILLDEYRDIEEDIEEEEVDMEVEDIQKDLDDLKAAVTIIQNKLTNNEMSIEKKIIN